MAKSVSHMADTREVVSSTSGPSPAIGMVTIEKWSVVWECLWLWQMNGPLRAIEKSRALCSSPEFLSQPDITINVCEKAIKPYSINQYRPSVRGFS